MVDLANTIIESLAGEMTVFNETIFEFEDYEASVTGHVQQDFKFEYSTDHFLLSGMELTSRHACFDEVIIYRNDEYLFTCEELYELEAKLEF